MPTGQHAVIRLYDKTHRILWGLHMPCLSVLLLPLVLLPWKLRVLGPQPQHGMKSPPRPTLYRMDSSRSPTAKFSRAAHSCNSILYRCFRCFGVCDCCSVKCGAGMDMDLEATQLQKTPRRAVGIEIYIETRGNGFRAGHFLKRSH